MTTVQAEDAATAEDAVAASNLGIDDINKSKFYYITNNFNDNNTLDFKFKDDIKELIIFSEKEKYIEKKKVFINLMLEFILSVKRFIELHLNNTADKKLKIETFHDILWKLKKIILIINSQNPMKVKNNTF